MAADLRQLRGRLEGVLRAGDRDDRAGVACFDCGGQLVRRAKEPDACGCPPPPVTHASHAPCRCQPVSPFHTHPRPDLCCLACHWHTRHASHDQGGRVDRWACNKCRREYTDREYHLAVRARLERDTKASQMAS